MGRYAQARHRGRGNASAPVVSMDPPADEAWALNSDGFTEAVATLTGGVCVAPADGFQLATSLVFNADPGANIVGAAACADPVVSGGFGPDDTVYGWIRWMLAGVPVSGWSNQQSVPIS